jgi:hypothetical protein
MEAMIACFCEYEARRYVALGDTDLAAALKRQAHLGAGAAAPWILGGDEWRHLKNRFPRESMHGCDGYGYPAVYALLAANLFGVAYRMADESITEGPTFSEAGGRVVVSDPGFHKVYATCRGMHLQIDTKADLHYDATGLGRIQRVGVPSYLGLSCPFTPTPSYTVTEHTPERAVAIGPGWREADGWEYLAGLSEHVQSVGVSVECEGASEVAFSVTYHLSGVAASAVTERCRLTGGQAEIVTQVAGVGGPVCLTVPLWLSDGEVEGQPRLLPDGFRVTLDGHEYRAIWTGAPGVRISIESASAANRNGVYRIGRIETDGNELRCVLTLR